MYGDMFKGLGGCLAVIAVGLLIVGGLLGSLVPTIWHWLVPLIHSWSAP